MSEEAKFTKGEWAIQLADTDTGRDSFEIATVEFDVCCHRFGVRSVHDAHLIKTAPKLYKILDTLISRGVELISIDEIDDEEDAATVHSDFNDSVILAQKLLAEARGE